MSDPFVGEIRMFAGNFAPRGWAFCDGQLLSISQYDALFSLLGVMYGGDGRTTFALPDLRGRVPIHQGSGPGLSPRRQGERGGSETAMVSTAQLPSHTHAHRAVAEPAGRGDPGASLTAAAAGPGYAQANNLVQMAGDIVAPAGGGQAHANVQPFLCVHFIIALFGIYPSRN